MLNDPYAQLATRHYDLLQEAAHERLIAQLPARRSPTRAVLALACRRLATWIDDSQRYVRTAEAGRLDWDIRSTSVYIRGAESVTPPAARDSVHDVRRTNFVSR